MRITTMRRVFAVSAATMAAATLVAVFQPAGAATAPYATASAQSVNVVIPSIGTSTSTPTTATNDGTGGTAPVTGQGGVIGPNGFYRSNGIAQQQVAQAGVNGSSLACSTIGTSTPTLSSDNTSCSANATAFQASVNMGAIPVLNTALGGVGCNGLSLSFQGLVSYAYSDGTNPSSGATTIPAFRIAPCSVTGSSNTCTATQTLTFNPAVGNDLMAQTIAALNAVGTADCSQIANALQGVASQVSWLTNRQVTNPDGSFTVNGMYFSDPTDGASFQYATSTVGPNLAAPTDGTPMLSANALTLAGGALVAGAAFITYRRRRRA
ncbi:MAG: LPXTG cell wall anchor domain-containing protein [Marmoricola sp.]